MTVGLLSMAQLPPQQQTGSKTMDPSKSTAFVSGANRGLGNHLADQLISRPARVYGGACKTENIETSAGMLTATSLLTGDLPDISAEFGTNFYGALAMVRAFAGPIEGNGASRKAGHVLNAVVQGVEHAQWSSASMRSARCCP
jgi:hypothetical protein